MAAGGPVPAPAAGTPPGIVIAAEAIGLATARSSGGELNFGDDLDALDIVPEPSSFALAALGLVGLLGFARRRRAA